MLNQKQINPATPMTLQKQTGSVAVPVDSGKLYTKEVSGIIEVFFKNAGGQEIQLTSNGSVVLPTIPSLLPAGGTVKQILAKASVADYATAWYSVSTLLKEFAFTLPAGPDLATRLTGLTVTGLELSTGFDHTPAEVQFGTSVDTLVMVPTGLTGVVPVEVNVFEITSSGVDLGKGVAKFSFSSFKSNTAMTKVALMNFNASLDAAKSYIVHLRLL